MFPPPFMVHPQCRWDLVQRLPGGPGGFPGSGPGGFLVADLEVEVEAIPNADGTSSCLTPQMQQQFGSQSQHI